MLKTIKVIHLAPGESLLILTEPAPTPAFDSTFTVQPSFASLTASLGESATLLSLVSFSKGTNKVFIHKKMELCSLNTRIFFGKLAFLPINYNFVVFDF